MLFPKTLALLLVAASAIACAQAQDAPSVNHESNNTTTSTTAVLPDSTKVQPLKTRKADYPIQAARKGIQGQVLLAMHISETGDVESVEVISGDPDLAEAAVKAAKQWKFKPFIRNGHPVKVNTQLPFDFYFSDKVISKGMAADGSATSDTKTAMRDPSDSPSAEKNPNDAAARPQRIRVSAGITEGLLIHQVAPVYPPEARSNHVKGTVVLRAIIGKDGRLKELNALSGPQELIPAAIGAVQQWRYKPYLLMGEPVEIETQITINFQLR